MKCFYHTDMDGHCAGAIVRRFFSRQAEPEGEYLPINYKDDFPFDAIRPGEKVVIVDFSLQKDGDFDRLLAIASDIIWIDHHKTAIEKHEHLAPSLPGLRRDGTAGCELAWEYFFPGEQMPRAVALTGDYDVWRFAYGDDTNYFQTGARLYDTKPESAVWNDWLSTDFDLRDVLTQGQTALRYRDNYYAGLIKGWAFFTEFEGYRVIACNAGSVSSQLFDSVFDDYDLMMPFVFDGKQWTVSIYTKKPEIDCSALAKKYGGGGHRQASGFQCEALPFKQDECRKMIKEER